MPPPTTSTAPMGCPDCAVGAAALDATCGVVPLTLGPSPRLQTTTTGRCPLAWNHDRFRAASLPSAGCHGRRGANSSIWVGNLRARLGLVQPGGHERGQGTKTRTRQRAETPQDVRVGGRWRARDQVAGRLYQTIRGASACPSGSASGAPGRDQPGVGSDSARSPAFNGLGPRARARSVI